MLVHPKDGPPYQALNSPFRWVGGKSRLRKAIIPLLPPHTCYVELFAGAAWVLFGKPPSPVEVLNDVDQELINFFRVVREQPAELIAAFEWELVARAEFARLAGLDLTELSPVQRAHRFYYLIMAGWGGEAGYPRFQTAISDAGHGNRLAGALKTLEQRLRPIHQRLRTVIIEALDWRECLERYDRPQTVMYLDPPYPGNGANYRHNMRAAADHQELAARLKAARCRWILSSYDTAEVYQLYGDCVITPVKSASGMKTGADAARTGRRRTVNRETLITNFTPQPGQKYLIAG